MWFGVGDLVQINETHEQEAWRGCILVVDEVKPAWNGLRGYICIPTKGVAYYRISQEDVTLVGHVSAVTGEEVDAQMDKIFHVSLQETWIRTIEVEAPEGTSEEEIKNIASRELNKDRDSSNINFVFWDEEDTEDWVVERFN